MEILIRHKAIIAFICFFLFCVISLSVQSSTFTLSVEGVGSALAMPFQKSYHLVQNSVHKLWAGFTELSEVREELKSTREQLTKYESTSEDIEEIKLENKRLRRLLALIPKMEYESITAEIISKDPDNWYRTIIINKGRIHGVEINMPVVAFNGEEKAVVGKVIEVNRSISRIIPIISPDMKLGVTVQSTRNPGLMEGYSSNSKFCVVDYINKSAKLTYGEKIITSGQGGVFPPGLAVGKVTKTQVLKSSAFQKAVVEPYIDYDQISEVFIIKKVPSQELIEMTEKDEE